MDPAQAPAWIQAGGVVAFAFAVWFELRQQRRTIEKITAAYYKLAFDPDNETGPVSIPRTRTKSGEPPFRQ